MATHISPFRWLASLSFLFAPYAVYSQAEVPKVEPQYVRFFASYANKRSVPSQVLQDFGLSDNQLGRSFALVVGVDHYPNMSDQDLPPAAEDVRKLVDYLEKVEFFDEIVVLQNNDVNLDNLQYFLQSYFPSRMQSFPRSRFLLAWSGHGFEDGQYGFALTSAAASLTDRTHSINMQNLRVFFDYIRAYAYQALALLNTCNSGAFLVRPFGPGNYDPLGIGAHAISAGSIDQNAWGDAHGSGSLFFDKVLAGLDGRADAGASTPMDHLITVNKLFKYVSDQVKQERPNQTPQWGDIYPDGSKGSFFFFDRDKLVADQLVPAWDAGSAITSGSMAMGPAQAESWPPNAVAGGTYVVPPDEQAKVIPYLKIPDNFTIKFDRTISAVNWLIGKMEFGKNATIDASAPDEAVRPGLPGQDATGQASYGQHGADGTQGLAGVSGQSGVNLNLQVGQFVRRGSLWIRADGGPGGPGGRGGNGQLGGGSSCGNLSIPHTNGGIGGAGGQGGNGGPGGASSKVKISFTDESELSAQDRAQMVFRQTCDATCGHSQRPSTAVGDSGRIVVYGLSGCGGPGGPGGVGGGGGDSGRTRQCLLGDVTGGNPGIAGVPGSAGASGQCSTTQQ